MATVTSKQLNNDSNSSTRKYPIDEHGKLRVAYFYYKNETGGVLADGTEIDLIDLPFGRIRILPNLSRLRITALGASRVLDIGHRAYYPNSTSTAEAEDDDAFVANKDVSSAVNDAAWDGGATKMKWDIYSRSGVRLFATVDGGDIPANAILEGYVTYVTD